ncbi:MAG: flagellar protein [Lachnospiraceae bacterium]|nr:flagellar protein [Lachnospiraceae bacterium]
MDVRNCKGCSRLFNYIGGQPLCPECIKALDVKFDQVRDYVYDHPRAGMQEVAEENEVSVAQIKRWIREERLAFSDDAQVGLECEGCGKMIRTGRFCELCKAKYINDFSAYTRKDEPKEEKLVKSSGAAMRFLDSRK